MLNKSYSYLIPLLNEYCKIDADFYIVLENVYTNKETFDIEHPIIIKYANSDFPEFNKYIESFKNSELFSEIYYDEDNEYVSVILSFPEEFLPEYFLYKAGKFSQFSEKAKKIIISYILDYHQYKEAERVKSVLNKEEKLRQQLEEKLAVVINKEMELSSIPDETLETFFYE